MKGKRVVQADTSVRGYKETRYRSIWSTLDPTTVTTTANQRMRFIKSFLQASHLNSINLILRIVLHTEITIIIPTLLEGLRHRAKNKKHLKKLILGNSLAVQWLRLCTSTAGAQVWYLIRELRSHMPHRVAKKDCAQGCLEQEESRIPITWVPVEDLTQTCYQAKRVSSELVTENKRQREHLLFAI